MNELKISDHLSLSIDVAGEAVGFLATRGAGKSYGSAAFIEELHAAGIQLCIIDPTGVYWGLRSSADGKREGLPITILGGMHGDVPLEETGGKLVADLLVDTGQSLILDLSDFPTKSAQTRFMTDFLERLYRRKAQKRTTLHLIVDEADEFAPQKPLLKETMMLHNMEVLVRRGRSRGIGVTLITQRSATLNKNVLDLIDTLIAMRIGSPRDRQAIMSWVNVKAADGTNAGSGVVDSLPRLPTGTAWVWSPVRSILKCVEIRRIKTFDSYATPKPGVKVRTPEKLATIDLEKLGKQMKDTADRAKENDPELLKMRVRDLQSQNDKLARLLAEKNSTAKLPSKSEINSAVLAVFQTKQKNIHSVCFGPAFDSINKLKGFLNCAADDIGNIGVALENYLEANKTVFAKAVEEHLQSRIPVREEYKLPPPFDQVHIHKGNTEGSSEVGNSGLRRIMIALAQKGSMSINQVALRAGMAQSGTFKTYLSKARTNGWIEGNNASMRLTRAGGEALGQYDPLPTGHALFMYWQNELGNSGAARILTVLCENYPKAISYEEIAERVGMSVSGTFKTYLSKLRTLQLIVGGKLVQASDEFFN